MRYPSPPLSNQIPEHNLFYIDTNELSFTKLYIFMYSLTTVIDEPIVDIERGICGFTNSYFFTLTYV